MAVSFDAGRVEVTGAPVGLLANVMQAAVIQPTQIDSGAGQFAVSASGSLAYITGGIFPQDRWSIGWVDRAGKFEPLNLPPGSYLAPRLSPDGKRFAYNNTSDDWDLWIYEVSRGLAARLSMEDEQSVAVWTPDGNRVVFTSRVSGDGKLFMRNADGNGTPETLPISVNAQAGAVLTIANTWTSDGSLVFWNGGGLWLFPRGEKAEPRPLVASGGLAAEFSPDGRWLAYTSGRGPLQNQIFMQPYPAMDRREQLTGGNSYRPCLARATSCFSSRARRRIVPGSFVSWSCRSPRRRRLPLARRASCSRGRSGSTGRSADTMSPQTASASSWCGPSSGRRSA